MLKITHAKASANILRFVDEGRLTQSKWHGTADDGREIACLLGSISPKVTRAADCNGDLMPMWLAELTPILFDGIDASETTAIGRRFGSLVARWHVLTPAVWQTVLNQFLVRLIDDAVESARPGCIGKDYWPAVESACQKSKEAIGGNAADAAYAADAARAAARAAYAADAARAAARAAYAAYAAAYAADAAAYAAYAADAARAAARAARAARAAARAAYAAADAAYLRLFNFVLDQIEIAVCAAENNV